ncbi:DUF1491 family protein [Ancylobacter sp. A5.8]|uniref:DUF1491 family protein n=1 Tax=Ancylobacter gelatini TaxID=2919920 RepID=UPI001F4D9C86|nr:DUF1491 family protein [Ancylobacter gelatini]MCJ8143847.1 DUF1491 family protein [Ancylobacter gelatini]
MRLKSAFWVAALIRRANGAGAFAAVRRHGSDEAGAIFVKVATLDGHAALYAPALPSLDAREDTGDRSFEQRLPPGSPEPEVEERMRREIGYDADLWFVEIEDREGRHFLEIVTD